MKDKQTDWTNKSESLNELWTSPKEIPEYRVQMIELIVQELKKDETSTLMDCGCGTGLLFEYLPDEYKDRYYGVDFTQEMVDYCRNKYPLYKERFNRLDLTSIDFGNVLSFSMHTVYVTQNVIQHILLFQQALDNIFYSSESTIIMCERTHDLVTCIAGYEPAYRWRFNLKDFYDILTFFSNQYGFKSDVEIMGQPLTTLGEENMITIFRMRREEGFTLSDAERDFYNDTLFIRKPMIIREYIPKPRKRDKLFRFFKIKKD